MPKLAFGHRIAAWIDFGFFPDFNGIPLVFCFVESYVKFVHVYVLTSADSSPISTCLRAHTLTLSPSESRRAICFDSRDEGERGSSVFFALVALALAAVTALDPL